MRKVLPLLNWMLRKIMSDRGIWSNAPSISALFNDQPKQKRADTLDTLCTALECTPSDLWVHTPSYVKGV